MNRTVRKYRVSIDSNDANALDALGRGATDGLKLAANIAAMLIAFVALVSLVNFMLNMLGTSLETILGYIFMPLAFLMGAPWKDAGILGSFLGQKIVLTELIAYMNLSAMEVGGPNGISEKTAIFKYLTTRNADPKTISDRKVSYATRETIFTSLSKQDRYYGPCY